MLKKEQKLKALEKAIEITKKYSKGGVDKLTPAQVLEETYNTIIRLMNEIEHPKKD